MAGVGVFTGVAVAAGVVGVAVALTTVGVGGAGVLVGCTTVGVYGTGVAVGGGVVGDGTMTCVVGDGAAIRVVGDGTADGVETEASLLVLKLLGVAVLTAWAPAGNNWAQPESNTEITAKREHILTSPLNTLSSSGDNRPILYHIPNPKQGRKTSSACDPYLLLLA